MDRVRVLLSSPLSDAWSIFQDLLDSEADFLLLKPDPALARTVARMLDLDPGGGLSGPITKDLELLPAVRIARADVVILNTPPSDKDPGICSHLLAEYPDLLIVGLSPVSKHVVLYQNIIQKKEMLGPSEQNLLKTIRSRLPAVSYFGTNFHSTT